MKYDFDTPINRRGTSSFKWDTGPDYFGRDDVIPMWVADMDFACAPCIVEAVKKRADHPIYGYAVRQQPYFDAVLGWLKKRHGLVVSQEYLARGDLCHECDAAHPHKARRPGAGADAQL